MTNPTQSVCAGQDQRTTAVELTAKEIQTLTAAMAGNHPASLNEHRLPVLRKLARASLVFGRVEAELEAVKEEGA